MGQQRVSAVVSGAGFAASVWIELDRAVRNLGGTDNDIHRLGTPEGAPLIAEFARILVNTACNAFRVVVDLDQAFSVMIAEGHYDWKHPDITPEHFSLSGRDLYEVSLELVHLGKMMSTDEVLQELDLRGLRPARVEELFAFGAAYPEEQRKIPVVALGSIWHSGLGSGSVPYLWCYGLSRRLGLDRVERVWNESDRFLAVRK